MYRIYCENVYPEMIESVLQTRTNGYTILEGKGWYKGVNKNYHEKALVIEIGNTTAFEVNEIAKQIAEVTNQESVMVSTSVGTEYFIGQDGEQVWT